MSVYNSPRTFIVCLDVGRLVQGRAEEKEGASNVMVVGYEVTIHWPDSTIGSVKSEEYSYTSSKLVPYPQRYIYLIKYKYK